MTTATRAKDFEIKPTSILNFFNVTSSNGYDHYPLEFTGPHSIRCGCPAGEAGKPCKHRREAFERFGYCPNQALWEEVVLRHKWQPVEVDWAAVLENIETEAEKDAYREMMEAA